MKKGLLLINLGTPKNPTPSAIRHYLRLFLLDKRVITLPAFLRYLLVYGFILPFRPRKTTHAYQAIWTAHGSPLRVHSQSLHKSLQQQCRTHRIALGMRYGEPSLTQALDSLKDCDSITILPLYPQYASSSSGSAIEAALKQLQQWDVIPNLSVIRDFYQHPSFIHAMRTLIQPFVHKDSFVLFSYHGLPQHQLQTPDCQHCTGACPTQKDTQCYRAQCFQTTALIAQALNLPDTRYHTCFQSRLGKTPWIQPYTDTMLTTLAQQGIKHLTVVCPSFVTDCLETLEEIGIQAKKQWQQLTQGSFALVPSLNDNELFIQTILDLLKEQSHE